jgi:ArsR family transcriptional regulator
MPALEIDCVEFCKALADETRQGILKLLQERGELCVGDIVDIFATSQPTISHHLRLLRGAGLVTARKQGKLVYYALNQDNVAECCGMLMVKFNPSVKLESDVTQMPPVRRSGMVARREAAQMPSEERQCRAWTSRRSG